MLPTPQAIVAALAEWYERRRGIYSFRQDRTPYKTWITEIFLQQTQITAALNALKQFLHRFPDAVSLAKSPLEDVLSAFRGMGYYARARNLHRAANYILTHHGGQLPINYSELVKIPGIGHYTAAIIASIHNGEKILAADGNQARVLARLFAIPHPVASRAFREAMHQHAAAFFDGPMAPGDLNEALMQWGQEICRKSPQCAVCFAQNHCAAFIQKKQNQFPTPRQKTTLHDVQWILFAIRCDDSYQVVRNTSDFPFLRGEWLFPSIAYFQQKQKEFSLPEKIPNHLRHQAMHVAGTTPPDFRHAITHHRIEARLVCSHQPISGGEFVPIATLYQRCHSSLMQKALACLEKLDF